MTVWSMLMESSERIATLAIHCPCCWWIVMVLWMQATEHGVQYYCFGTLCQRWKVLSKPPTNTDEANKNGGQKSAPQITNQCRSKFHSPHLPQTARQIDDAMAYGRQAPMLLVWDTSISRIFKTKTCEELKTKTHQAVGF